MGLADCFEPCVECSNVILVCFDLMNGSMLGLFVIHCGGFWRIENKGFFFLWRRGGLRMTGVCGGWFDLGFIFLSSCSCSCWRLFQIWIHVFFLFSFFLNFKIFFISLKLIIPMLAFYNANKKYFWGKHYADVVLFFVVVSFLPEFFFFIKLLRGHFFNTILYAT